MIDLAIAAMLAAAAPVTPPALDEAAHALASGRLEQARIMIGNAVKAGASGPELDRLLADLAFTAGDYRLAQAGYQALLAASPSHALFAERIAISSIHLGEPALATSMITIATASPAASWRAWNARGVLADQRGDWDDADRSYARASKAAGDRPEILNNRGWSLLARGRWNEALALLDQAARRDPRSVRIANNLELARAAMSEDLPSRNPGEGDSDWAARLNDAGVVAGVSGDRKRAIAAFAQAISARDRWFERAANNLAVAEDKK